MIHDVWSHTSVSMLAGEDIEVQSFPLKYFWARTVVLSQGLEFDKVWVHADRIFDFNQLVCCKSVSE